MKKFYHLILLLTCSACSSNFIPNVNDYDVLEIGGVNQIKNKYDWHNELSVIYEDHENVLKNSKLQLKEYSEIQHLTFYLLKKLYRTCGNKIHFDLLLTHRQQKICTLYSKGKSFS